jgi:hypothetical protein
VLSATILLIVALDLRPIPARASAVVEHAAPPGPSLRQRRVPGPRQRGLYELRDARDWPREPPRFLGAVDDARFDTALTTLCARVAPARDLPELGRLVREAASDTGVEPFLLGALLYYQSHCGAQLPQLAGGLLQIQPSMFAVGARLPFPRARLAPAQLREPAQNLAVGAALLAMWQAEHRALDVAFPGTPHRTELAHFFWGDRVRSATAEDETLTTRRVLLALYKGRRAAERPSLLGYRIVSPLDGVPRLGASGPGEDREGGQRAHRGLDIVAAEGEPVRAIADGVVEFAGVQLPRPQAGMALTPTAARAYGQRNDLGAGGLFVRINHAGGVRSGYFHLSAFDVVVGQTVTAGQVIGAVGTTGFHIAHSHLHLELVRAGAVMDPVRLLGRFVVPPEATLLGEIARVNQHERLVREDRARQHAVRLRAHGLQGGLKDGVPTRLLTSID